VYVYKGTEWMFTGESWVPHDSHTDTDLQLKRELDNKKPTDFPGEY
jgi:hypothetical protein